MIISNTNQRILISQQIKKRWITNQYLKDENNLNFQYCKGKWFAKENVSKLKLLNTGSGLFQAITDVYSFYVGRKSYSSFNYIRYIEDFITLGFFVYSIERDEEGKISITYQPSENYINNDGVDTIYRKYIDTKGQLENEYILETTFVGGVIENKLYKVSLGTTFNNITTFKNEVPLDTINDTKDLQQYINTGLPQVLFVCKEDKTEQFPISTLDKIESLVYSIDRKILLLDLQFLQHGDVFRIFKNIDIPFKVMDNYTTNGLIDYSQLGYDLIGKDGTSTVEYVSNKNEMIDKVIVENEKQIRQISSITNVPIDFLGLESKEGNVGQGSRTLLQGAFLKKVQRFRTFLDDCFEGFENIIEGDAREDIFVKSDNELMSELKIAREAGLISQASAIQDYLGCSEEQAQEELAEINMEKQMNMTLIQPKDTTLNNNENKDANTIGSDNKQDCPKQDTSNI